MKSALFDSKANRNDADSSSRNVSDGKNVAALVPPTYGIDFIDAGVQLRAPVQRAAKLDEERKEPLQGKYDAGPQRSVAVPAESSRNRTGMPDSLKAGIESLSGMDLSDVRVNFNSDKPARLNALAYTQGNDIQLGPNQERHLPHEAWHVVQQRQGRVNPTVQAKGVRINDDATLEREADRMGEKASRTTRSDAVVRPYAGAGTNAQVRPVVQRRLPPVDAFETTIDLSGKDTAYYSLYRLLHVEVGMQRLVRPVLGTKYTDAFEATDFVFPGGTFDRVAYAALYGANEKYASMLPPSQAIRDTDWTGLRRAIDRAVYVAKECMRRTLWIKQVFGLDVDVTIFQETYRTVAERLAGFNETNFTIDYNRDDPEMGLGGYSRPGSGKIQVSPSMLAADDNELAVTLIHEACHETDAKIIDIGYYGSARFDTMSARQKATNAAHYEEVARRIVGKSRYENRVFQPKAEQKREHGKKQEVIRKLRPANEGLRNLWSLGVNMHLRLREIASGTSQLSEQNKVKVVKTASAAFQLPQTGVQDVPYLNQTHLAMVESVVNVLHRAQDKAARIPKEKDPQQRKLLVVMSPRQLALEAIARAGGFQGVDPGINAGLIDSMRTAFILADHQDPFPEFDDEGGED